MPLDATNFFPKGPVKSADMKQFYDLFTGVMTDQPVTYRNVLSIGGSQGLTTVPLKIFGAAGQNTNLIDLYPDHSSANPGFGFSARGAFAWGPGGTAAQDTFLSRIGTQHGHSSDAAGLYLVPDLEVSGNVFADGTMRAGRLNLGTGGAFLQFYPSDPSTVQVNRLRIDPGPITVIGTLTLTAQFLSAMSQPALSPAAYSDGNVQLQSVNNQAPRIGFHQTGSTAVALYKEVGTERLRLRGASNGDWGFITTETTNLLDANVRYLSTSDGSNGIITARNGSLYIRSSGGNYNAVFDTGSAGVLISGGPLHVQTRINANADVLIAPGNATLYFGSDGAVYFQRTGQIGAAPHPLHLVNSDGMWITGPGNPGLVFYTPNDPQGGGQTLRTIGASTRAASQVGGGEVHIAIRLFCDGDITAGSWVHGMGFIQTSNPEAKAGMTLIGDTDCMVRIRDEDLPVYTYQFQPPPVQGYPRPTANEIGFDAADVFHCAPEFAAVDAVGTPVAVNYANMAALLWGALRSLDARCVAKGI